MCYHSINNNMPKHSFPNGPFYFKLMVLSYYCPPFFKKCEDLAQTLYCSEKLFCVSNAYANNSILPYCTCISMGITDLVSYMSLWHGALLI